MSLEEQPQDLIDAIEGFLKNPRTFSKDGFLRIEQNLQNELRDLPGYDHAYYEHGVLLNRSPDSTKVSISPILSSEVDEALIAAAHALGTRKLQLSYTSLAPTSSYASSLARELGFLPRAVMQMNLTSNPFLQEAGRVLPFEAQRDISTDFYLPNSGSSMTRVLTHPSFLNLLTAGKEVFQCDPMRRSFMDTPSESDYRMAKGASGLVMGMIRNAKAKVAVRKY